jgi:hypothetical protein
MALATRGVHDMDFWDRNYTLACLGGFLFKGN